MRVLVINPVKSDLKNFCSLIEKGEHTAVSALTAKDAFESMRKDSIDAVIASKMTPDIPSGLMKQMFKQSDKASALPFMEVDSFKEDQKSVIEFLNALKPGVN